MKNFKMLSIIMIFMFVQFLSISQSNKPDSIQVAYSRYFIEQYGITWYFDTMPVYGQFANGDYWVVGPVNIVGITPQVETITDSYMGNKRTINGSMLNPDPSNINTGYDTSSSYGADENILDYDESLNVAIGISKYTPLVLSPGDSLVSSISNLERGSRHDAYLKTAAVLTCLSSSAPSGSFRPAYCGSGKSVEFNKSSINYSLLESVDPVSDTPSLSDVERIFERPWIDHKYEWPGRYLHPAENMQGYGRNIASDVSIGALMVHLKYSDDTTENNTLKETLVIRLIQLGIDNFGVLENGGVDNWLPSGGHNPGRKWPIIFAGMMLNDPDMKGMGTCDGSGLYHMQEDGQTFYVTMDDVNRTHEMVAGIPVIEYEVSDIGLAEWGIRHSWKPETDNKNWIANYRRCCTANSWNGSALSIYMMDANTVGNEARTVWAHEPFFDYTDRYMDETIIQGDDEYMRSWDPFLGNMWDAYRSSY